MTWVAVVIRNPLILVCTDVYYSGQGGERVGEWVRDRNVAVVVRNPLILVCTDVYY